MPVGFLLCAVVSEFEECTFVVIWYSSGATCVISKTTEKDTELDHLMIEHFIIELATLKKLITSITVVGPQIRVRNRN